MLEIGQKVFCLDPETRKIYKGKIVGLQLSGGEIGDAGHLMVKILNSKGKAIRVESGRVRLTEAEAKEYAAFAVPIMEEIDVKLTELKEYLDRRRGEVIGLPMYPELAAEIVGKVK